MFYSGSVKRILGGKSLSFLPLVLKVTMDIYVIIYHLHKAILYSKTIKCLLEVSVPNRVFHFEDVTNCGDFHNIKCIGIR